MFTFKNTILFICLIFNVWPHNEYAAALKYRNNTTGSNDELQHIQRTQRMKKAAFNQPCHFYTEAAIQ